MSDLTSMFSGAPTLPVDVPDWNYLPPAKSTGWLDSFGRAATDFGKQLLRPEALVPALASGAGYLMQASALRDAQKQADQLAAGAEEENRALTQRAQQMAEQRAAERVAATRNYAPLEAEIEGNVRSIEQAVTPSLPARAGKMPAEYGQAVAATANTEAARREQLRKLFARMVAPGQAETLEQLKDARFAGDLGALGQQQSMLGAKNRTQLSRVSPSGAKMVGGGLLGQVGAAFARNALMRP
jgi:hypothetical protein